jgi:hypothetical protein
MGERTLYISMQIMFWKSLSTTYFNLSVLILDTLIPLYSCLLHKQHQCLLHYYIEYIIPKLRSACFAMRTVIPLMTIDTLKLVYFACHMD